MQNWIADSAAQMQAARLMTLHAAWRIDTEGASAARREIALIKFFGAGVLHDVVDRALQAHGALGYSTDLPLEAMYRFARAARLYDGPDEVHRQSVARQILRGYEAPRGRRAERARPDRAGGGAREVRRPARGGDLQRLSAAVGRWSRGLCAALLVGGGAARRSAARLGRDAPAPARSRAAAQVDRFDSGRAWAELRAPGRARPAPGRLARAAARSPRRLRARCRDGRFERVPGHRGLRNVVGRLPGTQPAIVIAAHYDTKELPGFVGANDGAAGTAAVLELARALAPADRPPGAPELRFVLFDGEEATDDRAAVRRDRPARLAGLRARATPASSAR